MIDDPIAARRLARAICTDVELYNAEKIRGVAPAEAAHALAEPMREGRRLFASRVVPAHIGVFEEVVRAMCERLGLPYHPPVEDPYRSMPSAAAHPPVPVAAHPPVSPRPASGVAPALVVLIAFACAIGGAAVFFVLSH